MQPSDAQTSCKRKRAEDCLWKVKFQKLVPGIHTKKLPEFTSEASFVDTQDIQFGFYRTTEIGIAPTSTFSSCLIPVEQCICEGNRCRSTLAELFDFDLALSQARHAETLRYVLSYLPEIRFEDSWSEKRILLHLSNHVLLPLFVELHFESGYSKHFLQYDNLLNNDSCKCGNINMGRHNTWHGSPDLLIRQSICVVSTSTSTAEEGDSRDSSPSPAGSVTSSSVCVEAKKRMSDHHNHQLVATAVTSSFISLNMEKASNPMVPTFLINKQHLQICLFDCVNDVLLISKPVPLFRDNVLLRSTLFLLWIVVHHRLYLRKFVKDSFPEYLVAKIVKAFDICHCLDRFQKLDGEHVEWTSSHPFEIMPEKDIVGLMYGDQVSS